MTWPVRYLDPGWVSIVYLHCVALAAACTYCVLRHAQSGHAMECILRCLCCAFAEADFWRQSPRTHVAKAINTMFMLSPSAAAITTNNTSSTAAPVTGLGSIVNRQPGVELDALPARGKGLIVPPPGTEVGHGAGNHVIESPAGAASSSLRMLEGHSLRCSNDRPHLHTCPQTAGAAPACMAGTAHACKGINGTEDSKDRCTRLPRSRL